MALILYLTTDFQPDLSRHFDVLLHDAQVSVQISVFGLQNLQAGIHGLVQSFIVIRR